MKELSIEEKAKAYDEVLKKARLFYKDEHVDNEVNSALEVLFPELKESEDEKNIKDLIDELKCSLRAANCQNDACGGGHEKRIALLEWSIAWLEKQGELNPAFDIEIPFGAKDSELIEASYYIPEGFHAEIEGNNVIIKKGEKKSADGTFVNVDDVREDFVQEVYRVLDADSTNDRANQIIDAFDNLPTATIEVLNEEKVDNANKVEPRFKAGDFVRSKYNKAVVLRIEEVCNDIYKTERGGYIRIEFQDDWELMEEKSAWSEEDESNLNSAIYFIRREPYHEHDAEPIVDWLRALKNRVQPQPKQEWSEEDKKIIDRIESEFLALHRGEYKNIDFNNVDSLSVLNWVRKIKSLSFQSRWKPSDEQMITLRHVISGCSYDIEPLVEIEEQLKKLMEE